MKSHSRRREIKVLIASMALLLAAAPNVLSQTPALVIEGGTLIDGTGSPPLENAAIVIRGNRIVSVGVAGKIRYPPSARVVKVSGKFILPGLIDISIHFQGWDPQMLLHYGVTTAYDTLSPNDWIIAQREMIRHGKIKGPRLYVTGVGIGGPRELSRLTSTPEQNGTIVHVVDAGQARAAVRKNASDGVDIIHVEESLTPDLLRAVMEEAHRHNLPVIGHSRDIRDAISAGLRYSEHTVPIAHSLIAAENPKELDEFQWKDVEFPIAEAKMNPARFDSLIELMVGKGVFINPTLAMQWQTVNPRSREWAALAKQAAQEPGVEFAPEAVRRRWMSAFEPAESTDMLAGLTRVQEFVRRYAQDGGNLLVGTDSIGSTALEGLAISIEMQALVDAGATPMQAIVAATKNAAAVANKERELGTVSPGKFADILVVDADPLRDISAVRKVALVVKDGAVIERRYDPQFVNPIPRTTLNGQLAGPADGPEVLRISPSIAAGGSFQTLKIRVVGHRFHSTSVVRLGKTELPTRFINESELEAAIPAGGAQKVGAYRVTVKNGDSGVESNLRYLIATFKY